MTLRAVYRLGDITDLNWGDTNTTKKSYVPAGFPAYSATGQDGFLPYHDFDRTGVVVSAIGAKCGRTWLAKGKWSCIKNTIRFWSTSPDAETEYLYWLTRDPDFWPKRGSAQTFISQGDARAIEIGLPPVREQRAIAHILGTLDDKIELNRRMNETLEAMARALFKSWFVDFDPVHAKMEGRDTGLPQDVADLFPDRLVTSELGEIPENWIVQRVSDCASIKGGKQLPRKRFVANGSVPVFGGAGLMGYTDVHNSDGFVISVGRVGAYCGQFFSHRGPAWINNNASQVTPKTGVPGEWLLLALRDLDIDVIKKGAAQPFVSNADLSNMTIIGPTNRVVRCFSQMSRQLFRRSDQLVRENFGLTGLRDTLRPRLISGVIRVSDTEEILGRAT